jgi:flavin reductase (DIM6/NTAB) family NADH-FMN oxidoreductase RutF
MGKRTLKPAAEFTPSPVVLVTCGTGQKANIIAISWAGVVCSDPPMVGVAVRPSRHSHSLMMETPEFAVNFPTEAHLRSADLCGNISGRAGDKFAAAGFTPLAGEKISVPIIAECPLALECKTVQVIHLGSHDLFLGEVLAVRADEEIVKERGGIDYWRIAGIAAAGGNYWAADRAIAPLGFSANKEMS